MQRQLRALNRFGLGARIGEAEVLGDPEAWLRAQLDRAYDPFVGFPDLPSMDDSAEAFTRLRAAQRAQDQEAIVDARRRLRELIVLEGRVMLTVRVRTDRPFLERWVAFWSNHLCVSAAAKQQVAALAGHYERTAIRPHVLGRFDELVLASAKHPAMLFYLDNFQSIGPESTAGRRSGRRGRERGLNENYARELLELHTVGVDGGYDQDDVESLARVLTGWTVAGIGPGARDGASLGFTFRRVLHEPGDKSVMGRRYRSSNVTDGEAAIRDLCRHPSTARFVATKLVRHFVSDDPPDDTVASLERVFLETEGDLRSLAEALIDAPDAWQTPHRKFRTPQEWLVAVLRAVHLEEVPDSAPQLLRQLRHSPWSPASPKGFGDTRGEWADPEALMSRAELARTLARHFVGGRRGRSGLEPQRLLDVVDPADAEPVRAFLSDGSINREETAALIIGGPAFQWR